MLCWLYGSDVSTVEKFMRESKSESVLHKYLALTSCLLENGGMSEPVPYVALIGLLKLAGDSTRRWNFKWISIHQQHPKDGTL